MSGEKTGGSFVPQEEKIQDRIDDEISLKRTEDDSTVKKEKMTKEVYLDNIDLLKKRKLQLELREKNDFPGKEEELKKRKEEIVSLEEMVATGKELFPEVEDPKLDPNYSPFNDPIHRDDTR